MKTEERNRNQYCDLFECGHFQSLDQHPNKGLFSKYIHLYATQFPLPIVQPWTY